MTENNINSMSPVQRAAVERIVKAGFRFLTLPRYERNLAVERGGFIALLDLSSGGVRLFGQVGLMMSDGVGILVERAGRKTFVCHAEEEAATPAMLDAYAKTRDELERLLAVTE